MLGNARHSKRFPLSSSLSLSSLSDKISRIFSAPRVVFVRPCSSNVLRFSIESRGLFPPHVIDETLPKCCTHFIFKQNLHKILLVPRGIASSDRYEILRNEFRVSRREFETVGLMPEISGRMLSYFED